MHFEEYQAGAARTINKCEGELINHALGLAGEGGEVIELIKKHAFHGKPLNDELLSEEIGDLLWYVAAVCTTRGLSLSTVASNNLAKLKRRYPGGFEQCQ
jgi:NTP pyrophosphatase (non-canonical NTP hydrolase)